MAKGKKDKKAQKGKGAAEGDEPKSGGSKKLLIIIIILVVLLLAMGGAGAWFFLSSSGASTPQTTESGPPEPAKSDAVYIEFEDFTVNLDHDHRRFIQVGLSVLTYYPETEKAFFNYMPQLRSRMILLIGSQNYHEVRSEEVRMAFRQKVLEEIRVVFEENGVKVDIDNVFFTKFVMQ